jgi:hypothetical protein
VSSTPSALISQRATQSPPIAAALKAVIPAERALGAVLSSSGARPAERDPIDARIVEEVRTSSGTLKDCTIGCPRLAAGFAHPVHTFRQLTLPKRPFRTRAKDGYTNLEYWLHRFSAHLERQP